MSGFQKKFDGPSKYSGSWHPCAGPGLQAFGEETVDGNSASEREKKGDRQTDKEGLLVGTVLVQPFRKKWSLMLSSRQLSLGLRVQERLGVGPLSPGPPGGVAGTSS